MTLWIGGGLAVAALLLFALDRMAVATLRPVRRPPARTPAELGRPFEDVRIGSDPALLGWWLSPEPAPDRFGKKGERESREKAVVVLAHGWGANAAVFVDLAGGLAARGHPVLLFDYRGHGRSGEAAFLTIRHYRDDTEAVLRWVRSREPGRATAVVGHSMGAAAGVLALADGAPAEAVALLAGPADVLEVTALYLRSRGLPGRLVVFLCKPFWRIRAGEPFRRLVPEQRIGELRQPVIVVQPEHDRRVPESHARRLARAAGVDVTFVAGADHRDVLERQEVVEAVSALAARATRKETGGSSVRPRPG